MPVEIKEIVKPSSEIPPGPDKVKFKVRLKNLLPLPTVVMLSVKAALVSGKSGTTLVKSNFTHHLVRGTLYNEGIMEIPDAEIVLPRKSVDGDIYEVEVSLYGPLGIRQLGSVKEWQKFRIHFTTVVKQPPSVGAISEGGGGGGGGGGEGGFGGGEGVSEAEEEKASTAEEGVSPVEGGEVTLTGVEAGMYPADIAATPQRRAKMIGFYESPTGIGQFTQTTQTSFGEQPTGAASSKWKSS